MTQVAVEFGIDVEPERRNSPFVYSVYQVSSSVKDLVPLHTSLFPISTLYSSKYSHLDQVCTNAGLQMVTKIDFPIRMDSNEELRNRVEDQFKFLQLLEDTEVFVMPYGMGQAINTDTRKAQTAILLEFVKGVPLSEAIYNHREYSSDYVTWFNLISAKLCYAVSALQNASLVHRDLSGSNILVNDTDLKIIDVDIAKVLTEEEGIVDSRYLPISTPAIAPPEAFKDNIYSRKTDIYALGIHHLTWLTGITDSETICNLISEIHAGITDIPYDPCLECILPRQRLDEFKGIILPLLTYDYHNRPDNLFVFRRKFTRILNPSQQLIYARKH